MQFFQLKATQGSMPQAYTSSSVIKPQTGPRGGRAVQTNKIMLRDPDTNAFVGGTPGKPAGNGSAHIRKSTSAVKTAKT